MSKTVTEGASRLPFERLVAEIERVYDHVRELPVLGHDSVTDVRNAVASAFDLERPTALGDVFDTTAALLREHTLQITHPRHFGLFNSSVHPSAILADALVALYNPQLGGWSHAPAANEMERLVLRRLAQSLGLDPDATAAHFTSGGNEANHTAVLAALVHRFPEWSEGGVRALTGRPVIYLSRESHHSFVKIARAVGLGTGALREIEVDASLRMRIDALVGAIENDRRNGDIPVVVVATAGTTGAGAIDPMPAIAELAAREGIWFHVDAAWGGAAALVPRLRHHMDGAGRADSLTWDAHKWLSVPLGAGMVFCRHPEALARAFGVDTAYVPPTEEGAVDLYKTSMLWSRRFIGLKLLFAFAENGFDGIARFVEGQADTGDLIRRQLASSGWTVVNDSPLPLVCFSHPSLARTEEATKAIVSRILGRQRVWISDVSLPGQGWVLRACVTSFRTNADDVRVLIEELEIGIGTAQ